MSNETRIRARIAGREAAADCVELIGDAINNRDLMLSLIEELRSRARLEEPPPPIIKHEPIGRLGSMEIPFGQHKGKTFDEVPLDYLDWLCRQQEDFYKSLRAYLKHPELESRRRGL